MTSPKRALLALAVGIAASASPHSSHAVMQPTNPVSPASLQTAIGQPAVGLDGIHKIQHVVIIIQENHSFDNYFGTFPRADGIPMRDGTPVVCVPDPATGRCVRPFHDTRDVQLDPPHQAVDAINDINDGAMDGFIRQFRQALNRTCALPRPSCADYQGRPDVMGYHDGTDIPNYWAYAHEFVLQDHLFEPGASWSLPSHLFMVSGWSAQCQSGDSLSCRTELANPPVTGQAHAGGKPYAWTDITRLLYQANVSWAYYVPDGTEPACQNASGECSTRNSSGFVALVNPLPRFQTVNEDHQLGNIKGISQFYEAARTGQLSSVSWIVPSEDVSEHPSASIHAGQAYVTGLINALMRGPAWTSTAVFLTWDEWGGFYDHVRPPLVAGRSYGMRVPGLVISPYAKRGYVDHQVLSFGAYLKFIEDDFLGGRRLDSNTARWPDTRPTGFENAPASGDLAADFDFGQPPRSPMILNPQG